MRTQRIANTIRNSIYCVLKEKKNILSFKLSVLSITSLSGKDSFLDNCLNTLQVILCQGQEGGKRVGGAAGILGRDNV